MTTDVKRQAEIYDALDSLAVTVLELRNCVREDIKTKQNTSETDLQIDLQNIFDRFLHKMGYLYDQRRW